MAIFEEQVLEPFIAKGIGNSGIASRQIRAGNLPNLSDAVRQSAMTQQNLQDQRASEMKALQVKNYTPPNIRGTSEINPMQPFIIGRTKEGVLGGGSYTIARPNARGTYDLQSVSGKDLTSERLKAFGLTSFNAEDIPESGLAGWGGEYSANQILEQLSRGKGDPVAIKKVMEMLKTSTAPVSRDGGTGFHSGPVPASPEFAKLQSERLEKERAETRNEIAKQNEALLTDFYAKRVSAKKAGLNPASISSPMFASFKG